jgi:hypothetical protein
MEAFFPEIDLSCAPMALTSVQEGAILMGKINDIEMLPFLIKIFIQ